jgi:hypothetical protein
VDVVIALDASHSVSDANWISENEAGRALLRGLRNALTTDMRAGVAVWANDGIIRQALTSVEDAATIDAMADVERLPYCGPMPGPYSPKADQYSAAFCTGAPPCVSDADHVYDVTHDASEVWGLLGVHTYYAQALLSSATARSTIMRTPSSYAWSSRTARSPRTGTRSATMMCVEAR